MSHSPPDIAGSDDPASYEEIFVSAGFSPEQARFATIMISQSELLAPETDIDGPEQWCSTFLPPEWICRLLANHVTDAAVGASIYEQAHTRPSLALELDIRADALGANCRDLAVSSSAIYHRETASSRKRPSDD